MNLNRRTLIAIVAIFAALFFLSAMKKSSYERPPVLINYKKEDGDIDLGNNKMKRNGKVYTIMSRMK